ncbi:MAG: J domain-containing protein [Nitrosotalea sp.]
MNIEQCYELLGLQEGASIPEIKSAYRRMVLEYHPDKNVSTKNDVKFKLVTEAYQTIRTKNVDVEDNPIYEKQKNEYSSYHELLIWTFYLNLPHDVFIYTKKILPTRTARRYFFKYKPIVLACGKSAWKYVDILVSRFAVSWYPKIKSLVLHVVHKGVVVDLLKYLGLHS